MQKQGGRRVITSTDVKSASIVGVVSEVDGQYAIRICESRVPIRSENMDRLLRAVARKPQLLGRARPEACKGRVIAFVSLLRVGQRFAQVAHREVSLALLVDIILCPSTKEDMASAPAPNVIAPCANATCP